MRTSERGERNSPAVAVVGAGHWGPNLIRNFHELGALAAVCDLDPGRLADATARISVRTTTSLDEILSDPGIDAVAIATPVPTHHPLALRALEAGKHVFVEKPLALSAQQAEEMAARAQSLGRVLMVGHLLEYHPAFEALKGVVASGELGELRHVRCSRLNLGIVRDHENVLWSFAPHDLSLILRLTGREPIAVQASGHRILGRGPEDLVYADLDFGEGLSAHVHVSWLEPIKHRETVVVGSRKMAVFNDGLGHGKLRVFDRGFDPGPAGLSPRSGIEQVIDPPPAEPMRRELEDFLSCCRDGSRPLADAISGIRVVRTLERISAALAGGAPSAHTRQEIAR